MRDIVLSIFLFAALPFAVLRPFVAIGIFVWISLMNPHKLSWGFATSMPWAQMFALAAIFSILIFEPKLILDSIRRYRLPLLYLGWMFVTTIFAVNQDEAWFRLNEVAKVHLMCLLTLAVLSDKKRINWYIAIVVGSVVFFGFKGGIYTLTTGGGGRVWGPPTSAIADNNHLAAALVFMFPLLYWAYTAVNQGWQKIVLLISLLLVPISILGSQSRGAFLGAIGVAGMLFLRSKGRVQIALITAMIVGAGLYVMPDAYWNRISTINEYEEDSSAQGRLHSWTIATRIANHRITGAGFEYYGSWLYREHADNPDSVHSSHSIYFQALGEHGWVGLGIFLLILLSFWRQSGKLVKVGPSGAGADSEALARSFQVALAGYLLTGIFVNIGNWDGFYFVYVIVLAHTRLREQSTSTIPEAEQPPGRFTRRPRNAKKMF